MTDAPSLSSQLYSECRAAVRPQPKVAVRGGVPGADLETLIVWNIVIAGVLHVGCGVLAHSIYEWLKQRLRQIEDTIKSARCGAADSAAVRAEAATAEENVKKVTQALKGRSVSLDPASISAAKEDIKRILTAAGWTQMDPEERARVVVELVTATLRGPAGRESGAPATVA